MTASDYDCTLELEKIGAHAIRLGMRLVKGLRQDDAMNVVAARAVAPFTSVEDVALSRRIEITRGQGARDERRIPHV